MNANGATSHLHKHRIKNYHAERERGREREREREKERERERGRDRERERERERWERERERERERDGRTRDRFKASTKRNRFKGGKHYLTLSLPFPVKQDTVIDLKSTSKNQIHPTMSLQTLLFALGHGHVGKSAFPKHLPMKLEA